ncbi:DUF2271 domain-containing protein [Variovorax sp. VNK109]|uniref:DUF2271 domain-containing protein n=1 Tax=Variovorax sp. VNK109 TaxID=3400919 RepID=UPI003C0A12B7
MKTSARPQVRWFAAAAVVCASVPAVAAGLTVQVTLPGFTTANAYRPYLAAWVEQAADNTPVGTLAVWYDVKLRDGLGKSWLRQLRTWWRGPGAQLALPMDGVSGATRPAGVHTLHFAGTAPAIAALPAGRYLLAVEVVRERGDRELLRVPFEWGGETNAAQAEGSKELGKVLVTVGG